MDMDISFTGVRQGEVIAARPGAKQNQGTKAILKSIYDTSPETFIYNPMRRSIEEVLRDNSGASTAKIRKIKFFKGMDDRTLLNTLIANANKLVSDDVYLEDLPLKIKFLSIAGDLFAKAWPSWFIEAIVKGDSVVPPPGPGVPGHQLVPDADGFYSIKDIFNSVPRAVNANGVSKRGTLVFRPSNWVVDSSDDISTLPAGSVLLYFSSTTSEVTSMQITAPTPYHSPNIVKATFNTPKTVYIAWDESLPISPEVKIQLINYIASSEGVTVDYIEGIMNSLKFSQPSHMKSLLQKLIRFGSDFVTINDVKHPTNTVLLTVWVMLLFHPGSLVPDIQRYVTGAESAFKRLVVSIFEDSYVEATDSKYLVIMLLWSTLAQLGRKILPPLATLYKIIDLIKKVREEDRIFEWQTAELPQMGNIVEYALNLNGVVSSFYGYYLCTYLLNDLGSFESDINMVGYIALVQGRHRPLIVRDKSFTIPIYHFIDQHCTPEIAYLIELDSLKPYLNDDYSKIFSMIFYTITGVNLRRERYAPQYMGELSDVRYLQHSDVGYFENKAVSAADFAAAVRKAQHFCWQALTGLSGSYAMVGTGENANLSFELSLEWLPLMIGVHNFTHFGQDYIVTMRPLKNLAEEPSWVVIKRPKRGDSPTVTEAQATEEVKQLATQYVVSILRAGIKANVDIFPEPVWIIYDDTFHFYKMGEGRYVEVSWELINRISSTTHPSILPESFYNGEPPAPSAPGVCLGSLSTIFSIIDLSVLRRAFGTILAELTPSIKMYKISRNGKGQEYSVRQLDSSVHKIMRWLCHYFPGVLTQTGITEFTIRDYISMRVIVDTIKNSMKTDSITPLEESIIPIDNRVLYEHQVDTVENISKKKRGHAVWINVGMGKTLIVMRYIRKLLTGQLAKPLPKYILYTLPASAMESIQKEIILAGYRYYIVGRPSAERPFSMYPSIIQGVVIINLVEHDTLRSIVTDVVNVAPDTLFIVDEFHKTLNKTLRTSAALEIARLSLDFIAMSGTISDKDNVKDLMKWLSQVVDYPINENNYWIALNSMISKVVETGVPVNRYLVKASGNLPEEYYNAMSPANGGNNPRAGITELTTAVNICYDLCLAEIIRISLAHLAENKPVFIVTKDTSQQEKAFTMLLQAGISQNEIFLIGRGNSIVLNVNDTSPIRVVITTIHHSAGYTITKMKTMLTSVYFTGQNTRTQLEGRINRIGQNAPVNVIVVYIGILKKILDRYEYARSLAEALKGLSE